jgi:hypothetical protein
LVDPNEDKKEKLIQKTNKDIKFVLAEWMFRSMHSANIEDPDPNIVN